MTPEQFCYWLQGFAEMNQESASITDQQWLIIKDHLQTVFTKVTPDRKVEPPSVDQADKIIKRIREMQEKDPVTIPYNPQVPRPWVDHPYQPMPIWCKSGDDLTPPTVIC